MTHLVQVSRPQDALAFLRSEFPLANMQADRNPDGDIVAFTFIVGRSRQFCPVYGGGIDFRAVRLFRDCQVYARDKRAAKRRA
jgi:hypothetical protein